MGTFWGILEFYKNGGAFMHPILLVLAIGTAIIIERLIVLSKAWTDSNHFWNRIEDDIRARRLDDAIQQCKSSEAALPKVIIAGLEKAAHLKPSKDDREELDRKSVV